MEEDEQIQSVDLSPKIEDMILRTVEKLTKAMTQLNCELAPHLEQERIEVERTMSVRIAVERAAITTEKQKQAAEMAGLIDLIDMRNDEKAQLEEDLVEAKRAEAAAEARQHDAQQAQHETNQANCELKAQLAANRESLASEREALASERTKIVNLQELTVNLDAALATANMAANRVAGRLEGAQAELADKVGKINLLEESAVALTEKAAVASGRLEVTQAELNEAWKRTGELQQCLTTTAEKAAAASGRLEATEAELNETLKFASDLREALATATATAANAIASAENSSGRLYEMQKRLDAVTFQEPPLG